jgi:AhpD family alkylhydroperoxidase
MQSVKQEPIYLSYGENNPQPSHYLNLIQTGQNTGPETWNIWYLFSFRPEMTQHLAGFTQEVMREPSSLSPGLRELIASYISYVNECEFCTKAHVAVAAELLGSEDLVWTALRNLGHLL